MNNRKPLYVHLHIPKTAGYTFRYHVDKNLKKDEQLFLCYEFLDLDLFNPPLDYDIYRKKAFGLIKSLSKEKRDNLKLIHGHTVPYGIHELFDREVRYFTFMRDPIDRTVSIYNHLSYLNSVEGQDERKKKYYRKYLLVNNSDDGFSTWLEHKYIKDTVFTHFSMCGYLKEYGYLKGNISKESIDAALDKFYFTGLTQNFNMESLYFFGELNMHKYFVDQNISKKVFNESISETLSKSIVKRNAMDNYLFKRSETLNEKFKVVHPEFNQIVNSKYREKSLLLPFTQIAFAPRQTVLRLFKNFFSNDPIYSDPTYFSRERT